MRRFRPLIVMSAFLAIVSFVATKGLDAAGGGSPGPDRTAPRDPETITSSSHRVDQVSEDPTIDARWTPGVDPDSDGEIVSRVAGYSVQWSQEPDTTPDPAIDVTRTSVTSPELADGPWWLHLRTIDGAGNSSTAHFGPLIVRRPPPTTTTSTTVAAARRSSSPTTTARRTSSATTRPTTRATTATTNPPTTSPPPPPPQTTTTHYHPPGHDHA